MPVVGFARSRRPSRRFVAVAQLKRHGRDDVAFTCRIETHRTCLARATTNTPACPVHKHLNITNPLQHTQPNTPFSRYHLQAHRKDVEHGPRQVDLQPDLGEGSGTSSSPSLSRLRTDNSQRDFFSFCGKIQSLSVTPESGEKESSQSATVTFEKETAAKTALLLDNTQLGPAQVHVTSAASLDQMSGGKTADRSSDEPHDDIAQEDKPRSRIVAEYLAHGYVLSDNVVQKAISMDQQHGVSNRFLTALTQFDQKTKASERAQAVDQKYGLSAKAGDGWRGLTSYFEKASTTPTGQRLRGFYEQGQKQVLDVHNEAKHLAALKSGKNPDQMGTHDTEGGEKSTSRTAEEAEMEKVEVDGKEKTKCNCGGEDGKCPCPAGQCACSGCSKAS